MSTGRQAGQVQAHAAVEQLAAVVGATIIVAIAVGAGAPGSADVGNAPGVALTR